MSHADLTAPKGSATVIDYSAIMSVADEAGPSAAAAATQDNHNTMTTDTPPVFNANSAMSGGSGNGSSRVRPSRKHQQEIDRIVSSEMHGSSGGPSGFLRGLSRTLTCSREIISSAALTPRPTPRRPPPCNTTVAQQLEANYDELWVRTTGIRNKRFLFFIIPGNPGVTKAYRQFAKLICLQFSADVCVVSHLGHCSFSDDFFGVESQIAHHLRILRKHSRDYASVVLLGHSIGGYFAIRAADQATDMADKISAVGLIAPTVSRFSWVMYWPLKVMSTPLVDVAVSALFAVLPGLRWLRPGVPQELFNELRGGKFFGNVLYLCRDELNVLRREVPREVLWKWGAEKQKLFIVYAKSDNYVNHAVQCQVKYCAETHDQKLPSVVSLNSISHSFCLNAKNCHGVIKLMSDFLSLGGFSPDTVRQVEFEASSKGGLFCELRSWSWWLLNFCPQRPRREGK